MSKFEPGLERRTKSAVVGSSMRGGIPKTTHEVGLPETPTQNEGLTNRILAGLPAPEFKRLLPSFEPVVLMSGKDLMGLNEPNGSVYFPESAVISHLYLLKDGSATAAAVIGNDGVAGLSTLLASPPPDYFTKVVIEGDGLRVKAEVIREEFARGESLQRLVLAYMSQRLTQVSQRAVCNGRHKLLERLCTWLLMIDDRTENKALGLTHADIATHLGARRAVISGCCFTLRTKGMIAYKRGHVIILDRKMLEAEACECYQVLKTQINHK